MARTKRPPTYCGRKTTKSPRRRPPPPDPPAPYKRVVSLTPLKVSPSRAEQVSVHSRHSGTLTQQPLRCLAADTDLDSYPLRARQKLMYDLRRDYRNVEAHLRGLESRITGSCALVAGETREQRGMSEVMSSADTRRIRKMERRVAVGLRAGMETGVRYGGEGERKWVVGGRVVVVKRLRRGVVERVVVGRSSLSFVESFGSVGPAGDGDE